MRITTTALLASLLLSTSALAADALPAAPPFSTDITKAAPGTYALDKNHGSITFKVLHMGFAYYTMRFDDFDSTITLDPADITKSSVKTIIQAASLDSNNPKLTEHVSSKDFLDVAAFPTITFNSTKVEKTGSNTGKIYGDLTIHGVTKPVVLDATFNGTGPNIMTQAPTIGFSAHTTIKRSEFSVGYGIPMVGDDISINIETEFAKK